MNHNMEIRLLIITGMSELCCFSLKKSITVFLILNMFPITQIERLRSIV